MKELVAEMVKDVVDASCREGQMIMLDRIYKLTLQVESLNAFKDGLLEIMREEAVKAMTYAAELRLRRIDGKGGQDGTETGNAG